MIFKIWLDPTTNMKEGQFGSTSEFLEIYESNCKICEKIADDINRKFNCNMYNYVGKIMIFEFKNEEDMLCCKLMYSDYTTVMES